MTYLERSKHPDRHRTWEPMNQRQAKMRLNREPAVRGSNEACLANSDELSDEAHLLPFGTDVLDDGIRMHDVERSILKRKSPTIRFDKPNLAIARAKLA